MNIQRERIASKLRTVGKVVLWPLIIVLSFGAGLLLHAALGTGAAFTTGSAVAQSDEQVEYTCSMHPQIRSPRPGRCPLCQMALIPADEADAGVGGGPRFTTSRAAKALMDIETAPVERKFVEAAIRMSGKVAYDETRLKHITAWVPGRLDRLYVDYTGVPVSEGDHLVYIYSPELLSAQEELLQARRAVDDLEQNDSPLMRDTTRATYEAAREKLRLLGLTDEQVARLEESGEPSDHLTINSPVSGVVVDKNANEGMYVQTGTRIYTVADLSRMWVMLDAYESDLQWLRYGQEVEFTTLTYPGQVFTGAISFISPVMRDGTRTVSVRVNVENPDRKLKPGMFVRAAVRSKVAAAGKVMDADLAGKWISPMHPEIVKDQPGQCDVCGMDLVRAESLGYVSVDAARADKPLVIPASAALVTGTRAVVYVEVPDTDKPTYEGHEIVLGPRAGQYYLVAEGLQEGQRVVTRGAFKIDSAVQLQADASMMSPSEQEPGDHAHAQRVVVNDKCPIMGSEIDPTDVPEDLMRRWKGKRVGFCCAGCPDAWDKLSESEKQAKLEAAMGKKDAGRDD
jgi:Cu(I)/Ag(I) efflux system membrane fusion protein